MGSFFIRVAGSFVVRPLLPSRTFFAGATAAATTKSEPESTSVNPDANFRKFNGTVTILDRSLHHLVVAKPPTVLCHHSDWAGSRSKKKQDNPEIPMLQRVRNAVGERVNVVHRLDRGCSGCLLFTFVENSTKKAIIEVDDESDASTISSSSSLSSSTAIMSDALADESSIKTYVALVRGEGILHGRDFKKEGWFEVTRPIKNERGILHNATTFFRFLAGQDSLTQPDRPRASLVLARPQTGRWHQIRRHLNGLSHPIVGDSTHGNSKVNREWKERGMPGERTCLHLARMQLKPNMACPEGIDVSCPLPDDMMTLLQTYLPGVLEEAEPLLEEEGIRLQSGDENDTTVLPFEIYLQPT